MTRTRPRAWLWIVAAALAVLVPAGWLGAEYAMDLEEMAGIRAQLDSVRALIDRSSQEAADSGEASACDRAGERLAVLASPPWWRHVGFSLLEGSQVEAASRRLAELRAVVAERSANRAWWIQQAAAIDAALAAEARTIPDLFALRDGVESGNPPHPESGGMAADARSSAIARIEADAAALADSQDRTLERFARAAEAVAKAVDSAELDAALAMAPGADARDLNPPELAVVRERLGARAEAIRAEFAFRAGLEASVAAALSRAMALDPESASAADAYAIVVSIDAVQVPEGPRYASIAEAKSQALDAARRRGALLEARDRDRAWLDGIAAAIPRATTARDAQALLETLKGDPPGGSGLESIARRVAEMDASLRSALQSRTGRSRRWREDLAGAVDAMVAARSVRAFADSSGHVDAILARHEADPSSSEDAQAERAARSAQRATAARLVRQELAPVLDAVRRIADPRRPPPEVIAALSPDSPLASIAEAQPALDAIRKGLEVRLAEHEAFDGAIERARRAMQDGDLCTAAEALASAAPRDAEQEWMRNDLRGALGEMSVEVVESLVIGEGSLGAGSMSRLERIVQCDALAACAPDASRMAQGIWSEVRVEADRALWEDCRSAARGAIGRRDAATYLGALSRYIASGGAMSDAASAARDAFAAPVTLIVLSEFQWGPSTCVPTDAVTDLTVTIDGETWSGPIPTGDPRRVVRLSHEWSVRSGADLMTASASGVCPCEEPEPFSGVAEIPLADRRFGATLQVRCLPLGTGGSEGAHTLVLKVMPSPAWLSALRLPEWRPPADLLDSADASDEPRQDGPRPESDEPPVTEPTPEEAP